MTMEYFLNLNPVMQALYGTLFTYALTALGAGMVFFFKEINKNIWLFSILCGLIHI